MRPELIAIGVLALIFILATARSVNLGALGFVSAFLVGALALDMSNAEIVAGFPGDIFIILVSLTYLFGIAQVNGTLDLLVNWCTALVRGRVAAVPWIFFGIAAILMSIGALFSVAIVAPLAMSYAYKNNIRPLMMGMMVVHGALGGAFSPISVYGSFVNGVVAGTDLPSSPLTLFLMPLIINAVIALAVYFTLGGRELLARGIDSAARQDRFGPTDNNGTSAALLGASEVRKPGSNRVDSGGSTAIKVDVEAATTQPPTVRREHIVTLIGLATLAIGVVGFGLDIGFLALTISTVLIFLWPKETANALSKVSWSTVFLICGVMTYVAVLEAAGTIDYAGSLIAGIGIRLLAALLLCYLGGIVSAFASSIAILGVSIPLAVPFLEQGHVSAIGMIVALAVSSTVVDVSPFSTNGALVLANAAEDQRPALYRQMLVYSGMVVLVGPPLAWLFMVVPGWF
ncbi:SLC13 family permease [Rhodococcus fascians]|nr:SLC13 family permease [Rhodococcus fascians]MBY4140887.1 SLC13 family permease [Rhodococcus fascians]MBY4219551.1 SLC13 family permease [Rhodococcus fascians]MBY4221860.1 SLC13 family permease [Rhodococcus fascians]MBY4233861.1 SLC13 family permease [Rhodococcus fascians]